MIYCYFRENGNDAQRVKNFSSKSATRRYGGRIIFKLEKRAWYSTGFCLLKVRKPSRLW